MDGNVSVLGFKLRIKQIFFFECDLISLRLDSHRKQ